LGYLLDGSSAGALQASLNEIKSEHVKQVLEILAAKPMQRAKYFCAGTPNVAKFHHYALNIPLYTHFTSPIRRFADVVVHRQLKAALSKKGKKKSHWVILFVIG
jgi:protein SSD1